MKKGGCIKENSYTELTRKVLIPIGNLKDPKSPMEIESIAEEVTIKIPIVLSKNNIKFSLDYTLNFHENIGYIEHIKNNFIFEKITFIEETNTLFISGSIRKTVYYVPRLSPSISKLKYFIVYIPFEICTIVDLDREVLQSSEIRFQPISSEIIDKIIIDRDILKNFMELVLRIDIIQEQYITLKDLDSKEDTKEDLIREDGKSNIQSIIKNLNNKRTVPNKANSALPDNKQLFIFPPGKKTIRNTFPLFLFAILLIKSNLFK